MIAGLLRQADRRDEAYDCYQVALSHLSPRDHPSLVARCHLACSSLALQEIRNPMVRLLQVQTIVDEARIWGDTLALAVGCRLLAQLVLHTKTLAIDLGEDAPASRAARASLAKLGYLL